MGRGTGNVSGRLRAGEKVKIKQNGKVEENKMADLEKINVKRERWMKMTVAKDKGINSRRVGNDKTTACYLSGRHIFPHQLKLE